jgi:hypothetical protein
MKFYNRDKELKQLEEIQKRSFEVHSQMTVVTGRRRIGKTKLILKSCEGTPTAYLFVGRNNEASLCEQFTATIKTSLNYYVPEGIKSFIQLFELIMTIGKTIKFNLIIDEFQEFFNINPAIFSGMQDVWDRYKDDTKVNFIASGSIITLMHKIFMDYGEPLYGRCDTVIRLRPFTTSTLKQIISDFNPGYKNDDLLALYTITGGVPKYVELLMERRAFTSKSMINTVMEENSIFLEEGTILLATEFGKKYGNYFSILSAIASGRNTSSEIAQSIGESNIGGMLQRLEEDYELISKKRPILSKERSQNVRYEIADNFMRFWFRYVARHQNLIQMGLSSHISSIAISDYPTYSGYVLEEWFRQKMKESGEYENIGSWWNTSKGKHVEQSEVDIVAIPIDKKRPTIVAEVKRQRKNFKPELLKQKAEYLRTAILGGENILEEILTLEDM